MAVWENSEFLTIIPTVNYFQRQFLEIFPTGGSFDDYGCVLPVHVPVQAVIAAVAEPDVLHLHVVDVDGLEDDLQLGHDRGELPHPCGWDPGHMSGVSLLDI